MEVAPKIVNRADGWENALRGLGTSRDSRVFTQIKAMPFLAKETLVQLYKDGLVRTIIDSVPDLTFKSLGYIQNDPTDEYDEGLLKRDLDRLQTASHFKLADKWRRLLGGSLIYIGAIGAGKPSTPLVPSKIKNIEYLKVFPLTDILTSESIFETNPNSEYFGKIIKYKVRFRVGNEYQESFIHATRCIPFYGVRYPDDHSMTLEQRYWGISIMQSMYEDIRDYRTDLNAISNMLSEATVSVYKFADLDDILMAGNEHKLQVRVNAINIQKSSVNGVILGTDEEYSRETISFSGISDIIDRKMMQISSVSGIPVSRLFGRSPGGLNATGGAEERIFMDMAHNTQNELTPEIQRLINILVEWHKLEAGDYSWNWNSLITLTPEQEAEEKRKDAEAERTLADAYQRMITEGVLDPREVRELVYAERLKRIGITDMDTIYVPEVEEVPNVAGTNNEEPEEPTSSEEDKPTEA